MKTINCPNCGAAEMAGFYEVAGIPVHSVLLLSERAEAVNYRRGDIELGVCPVCGFVANLAFDPQVHEYAGRYEATQGYSSTFNAFQRQMAAGLVERYGLRHKRLIEIGCGEGEFLTALCQLGDNHGVGFDPAYTPARAAIAPDPRVSIVPDFYSEKYAQVQGDFVCCRMTLEHIAPTLEFCQMVRRSIGAQRPCTVFFQVPNAAYVFGQTAFWDIYYEHCSYFNAAALRRLFTQAGFEVMRLWTDYDDQYLMVEATPAEPTTPALGPTAAELAAWRATLAQFVAASQAKRAAWRAYIDTAAAQGRRLALWGGGSKAVAFLTTLGIEQAIPYAVDINPHKAGTFIAGTGQEIIAPARLTDYRPDTIIVMNPVYVPEIQRQLSELGLAPQILTVHGP